jgi:hypothetical protein
MKSRAAGNPTPLLVGATGRVLWLNWRKKGKGDRRKMGLTRYGEVRHRPQTIPEEVGKVKENYAVDGKSTWRVKATATPFDSLPLRRPSAVGFTSTMDGRRWGQSSRRSGDRRGDHQALENGRADAPADLTEAISEMDAAPLPVVKVKMITLPKRNIF